MTVEAASPAPAHHRATATGPTTSTPIPMSGSRMRTKKLNYKQKICIQRGDSLNGAGSALVNGIVPEFETSESRQDSTFGVDSHELTEHHLQAALSSHQLEATQSSSNGATKRAYHIPTPKTTEVLNGQQYSNLYPPNSYSDPVTYVRYSDTVEDNLRGAPYCMDDDDLGWLQKHNDKVQKQLEQALKPIKSNSVASKEHELKLQSPEKYLVVGEDEFETVMSVFELVTCERYPLLELDFAKVPTLEKLLSEFEDHSRTAQLAKPELPPYSTPKFEGNAKSASATGKNSAKGSQPCSSQSSTEKQWTVENPFRNLSLLQPHARIVYPWWRLRRQARDGKPIVPSLNFDESNDSDPYVCFRRREAKVARKTRKTDTQQLEKLVRLRSEMMQAKQMFQMIAQREQLKEQQVKQAHACWTQASLLLNVKLDYGILTSEKAKEDMQLLFGIQQDPTAPVPSIQAPAQAAHLNKKKRKLDDAAATPTTLKLRRPKQTDGEPSSTGKSTPSDSSHSGGIGAGLLERIKSIQSFVERETQRHHQAEVGVEDLTDSAYQPPSLPMSLRAFRPIQSDNHDAQFWANHPFARLGRQPCFRRRVGRGGRVYLDRRPLTVSPAPASVLAWPRGSGDWPPVPWCPEAQQLRTPQAPNPSESRGAQRMMMFASQLKPTLLPTPDWPFDQPSTHSLPSQPKREPVKATRTTAAQFKDGMPASSSQEEVASTLSESTDRSKLSEDSHDAQSTQATDIEQEPMSDDLKRAHEPLDTEPLMESPEEQLAKAQKLAERWRYDEDSGRWAGLGLLGLGGMEGDEEAVLDDYEHRFMRYRMSLMDEMNLLKLSTDWTNMRQAISAAEVRPTNSTALPKDDPRRTSKTGGKHEKPASLSSSDRPTNLEERVA
ncbi:Enhancer of polycomb-like protein 1 [Malassezia yamatoensis]|uniref:Enhancer of polycomb-like protein n=1 Tax=Malassezia yamatoensis TaxID=253288 RepID=A0AAJ5YR76_9BASI|nr:Enhancer of polycomb-like protein 1 [Malassezia yamatoensis]